MAEFLIYNKNHWMDVMTAERYAELIKRPSFAEKYLARYQRNDVVEVRPDGFWTGPKAKGFNKEAFRVISVPGLKPDEKYMGASAHKRRRFSISTGALQEVTVVSNINDLTIMDKGING